jgi:hypothetical protein
MCEERDTFEPAGLSILATRSSERVSEIFIVILSVILLGQEGDN